LTADEQATWRALITATRLLFSQIEKDLGSDSSMPLAHYAILSLLSEAPGRALRMHDIASARIAIPSAISHAISRLEQKGWVKREMCPRDRRGWYAVLTDEGFAALTAAAPAHASSVRQHLFAPLSSTQTSNLRHLCEKLTASLET
jgi:DNA-binding MarR family transcriptional regulator